MNVGLSQKPLCHPLARSMMCLARDSCASTFHMEGAKSSSIFHASATETHRKSGWYCLSFFTETACLTAFRVRTEAG